MKTSSQRKTVDRLQRILSQILAPRIYFQDYLILLDTDPDAMMTKFVGRGRCPRMKNEYVRIRGRRKVRIVSHPIVLL